MRPATLPSPIGDQEAKPSANTPVSVREISSTGFWQRRLRNLVASKLNGLKRGQITLIDGEFQQRCGQPADDQLTTSITVHSPRVYRRVFFGGSLAAAEAYLDGDWDTSDLTSLCRIFARNLNPENSMGRVTSVIFQPLDRLRHWFARNSRRGSRRNIGLHYDLGDEFFRLFLDPTMMYSSAIFEREPMTLEQAQLARLDRICRKLDLRPTDHVLEIGGGWGGFALHAASNFGCQVTTTTISENQFVSTRQRVQQAGLEDRVTVLKQDYRDLQGSFDKLVSIEMIEAVGHRYFDDYFGQCERLLRNGGRLLLQAIVMPEDRYDQYLNSVDFIQKYIFPGGSLPSIAALQQSISRQTSLRLQELKDFAPHYARTLREWRTRFMQHLPEIRRLGYSDRFVRMWDYYLCYCEAAFQEHAIGVVQAVWRK